MMHHDRREWKTHQSPRTIHQRFASITRTRLNYMHHHGILRAIIENRIYQRPDGAKLPTTSWLKRHDSKNRAQYTIPRVIAHTNHHSLSNRVGLKYWTRYCDDYRATAYWTQLHTILYHTPILSHNPAFNNRISDTIPTISSRTIPYRKFQIAINSINNSSCYALKLRQQSTLSKGQTNLLKNHRPLPNIYFRIKCWKCWTPLKPMNK